MYLFRCRIHRVAVVQAQDLHMASMGTSLAPPAHALACVCVCLYRSSILRCWGHTCRRLHFSTFWPSVSVLRGDGIYLDSCAAPEQLEWFGILQQLIRNHGLLQSSMRGERLG
eukprot:gnl/TRDRNA2_/TRDRNA2_157477_c0_seq2.p1 gnl/TRDRNA2_/TRDRNA2_157477_c0~~gnl/TRDRNA2_/TRDRNA2_157477_c0_seq2.p1  ORF type:complete len:113 (-),score=5.79 gnl/TRDRNA2_/TRDRNA2_157477_c0_seq2:17-355(-)